MKNATFYLLNQHNIKDGMTVIERLTCDLATAKWREGKQVLIACEDVMQAIKLDEALWTHDLDAFIPHNLMGEGPPYGAPVELCWPQHHSNIPQRDLLINLLPSCVDFVSIFREVIDFVPYDGALRQLARDRYKAYRNIGFKLTATLTTKINCGE